MTNEAQALANRANAALSTGPRTDAGKQASSRNALRHGILAADAVIRAGEGEEESEAFARLLEGLQADLKPQGALEELLVGKLAVTTWRWRRVLRYELGAIREQADDAVRNWHRKQRWASADAQRERDRHSWDYKFHPPLEEWRGNAELEEALGEAEDRVAALGADDPLAGRHPALLGILAEAADELRLPVKKLLGLKGGGWDEEDLARADAEAPARLYAAYCQKLGFDRAGGWLVLRATQGRELEKLQAAIEQRRREEERVRLLAALPDDAAMARVTRYEAHLSKEFARTLDQLQRARAMGAPSAGADDGHDAG